MIDYKPGKRQLRTLDSDWNPLGGEVEFCESDFLKLLDNCGTVSAWDFNTSLGDSLREKYETLIFKLAEVAGVVAKKIEKPEFFWAALPSPLAMSLEAGLDRSLTADYVPMGGREPRFIGTLMARIKLYECPCMPENQILIGCGDQPKNPDHYARICICNYIV